MVIVWGSRLMGKCDVVPGLFHVQTRFGHLWYLPLVPTGSYLVLGPDAGVQVSLSAKSIFLAWGRAISFLVAFTLSLAALMFFLDPKPSNPWLTPTIYAAIAWVVCLTLCYAPFVTRASFNRAMQLAGEAGFTREGLEAIQQIYGQSAGRGFEIAQAARPTPAAPAQAAPRRRPVETGSIPLEP
jgi:hypothetical protein